MDRIAEDTNMLGEILPQAFSRAPIEEINHIPADKFLLQGNFQIMQFAFCRVNWGK